MGFLSEGKEKEKNAANTQNNVVYSNSKQDINEHWDYKVTDSDGKTYKYDVKGIKRINREDALPNEHYHFIEIKNVNGDKGWAYGDADFFKFETEEYWITVSKDKLQELIKTKTVKQYVTSPDKALYCLYQRAGRKDIMTLVKTIDLMVIASSVETKTNGVIKHEIGDSIDLNKRAKAIMARTLT